MWDRRYSAPDLVWGTEPNRRLVTEVEALPPGRAIDLGAGEGRNAAWLATRGWDVTAVDFSRAGLDRAEALARGAGVEVRTVLADLAAYVPAENTYDLAIILYLQVPPRVLDHVLRNAARSLSPDGLLVLIGHDVENLEHGHGGPSDPDVLQSPEAVARSVRDLLAIERAERIDRVVATPDGERTAIDTLVRARRTT